jgi:hypothetical protein
MEISFALSNLVNNKQKENIDGIQDYNGSKEIRERNECEQHDYQPFFFNLLVIVEL